MFPTKPFLQDIEFIITHVLKDLHMYSESAVQLVLLTGMAESSYRAISQSGTGPALGFWQVEPNTADDIYENYLAFRPATMTRFQQATFCTNVLPWRGLEIRANIALQIGLCRLKYRRDKFPIPTTLDGMAHFWKRIYNSEQGAGTIEHFIENAEKLAKIMED